MTYNSFSTGIGNCPEKDMLAFSVMLSIVKEMLGRGQFAVGMGSGIVCTPSVYPPIAIQPDKASPSTAPIMAPWKITETKYILGVIQ